MKIYEFRFKPMKILAESQEEAEVKLGESLDKLEITDIEESDIIGANFV